MCVWLLMVIPVKTNRSDLSVFAGCGVRVGSGEGQEEVAVTIPGVDSMSSIQQ